MGYRAILETKIYIYALRDPRTGLIRYIGKSTNPIARLNHHIFLATCTTKSRIETHVARWIRELVALNFRPLIVMLEETDRENWEERERYWITLFKDGKSLTNLSNGGDGVDAPRTEEWRRKIGAAHKGKIVSQQTRQRLSMINRQIHDEGCCRGHAWTPENTSYDKNGYRICLACERMHQAAARRKKGMIPLSEYKPKLKEFCDRGHPLDGENLRLLQRTDGKAERICRECVRIRNRKAKQAKRERDRCKT